MDGPISVKPLVNGFFTISLSTTSIVESSVYYGTDLFPIVTEAGSRVSTTSVHFTANKRLKKPGSYNECYKAVATYKNYLFLTKTYRTKANSISSYLSDSILSIFLRIWG
jgi:hypothetical protein